MKIPKKVIILGTNFKVKSDRKPELLSNGREVLGVILHTRNIIKIARNADKKPIKQKKQWQTFWHEIIHEFDSAMSLGLDEKTVNRLATCINAVCWQNKFNFSRKD